jgi:hypothetical protein
LPLPRTYKEIEEMVRRKVLTTDMARKIVRKAGFRPGTIEDTSGVRISAIPILDIPGTKINVDTGEPEPNPPYPGTSIACSLELQELIEAFQEEQG